MDRLLVIDDDPLVRHLLLSTLNGADREVAAATTARDGLARFQAVRPDVVLLDIHLPDRDGLGLFRELQELDGTVPTATIAKMWSRPENGCEKPCVQPAPAAPMIWA